MLIADELRPQVIACIKAAHEELRGELHRLVCPRVEETEPDTLVALEREVLRAKTAVAQARAAYSAAGPEAEKEEARRLLGEVVRKLKELTDRQKSFRKLGKDACKDDDPTRPCAACRAVKELHQRRNPSWQNSRGAMWPKSDGWPAFAKLYLAPRSGATDVERLDIAGCITMIEMCGSPHFGTLHKHLPVLEGVRDVRHKIMHGTGRVTPEEVHEAMRILHEAVPCIVGDERQREELTERLREIENAEVVPWSYLREVLIAHPDAKRLETLVRHACRWTKVVTLIFASAVWAGMVASPAYLGYEKWLVAKNETRQKVIEHPEIDSPVYWAPFPDVSGPDNDSFGGLPRAKLDFAMSSAAYGDPAIVGNWTSNDNERLCPACAELGLRNITVFHNESQFITAVVAIAEPPSGHATTERFVHVGFAGPHLCLSPPMASDDFTLIWDVFTIAISYMEQYGVDWIKKFLDAFNNPKLLPLKPYAEDVAAILHETRLELIIELFNDRRFVSFPPLQDHLEVLEVVMDMYVALASDVMKEVDRLLQDSTLQVFFTGHGVGQSLATLMSLEYQTKGVFVGNSFGFSPMRVMRWKNGMSNTEGLRAANVRQVIMDVVQGGDPYPHYVTLPEVNPDQSNNHSFLMPLQVWRSCHPSDCKLDHYSTWSVCQHVDDFLSSDTWSCSNIINELDDKCNPWYHHLQGDSNSYCRADTLGRFQMGYYFYDLSLSDGVKRPYGFCGSVDSLLHRYVSHPSEWYVAPTRTEKKNVTRKAYNTSRPYQVPGPTHPGTFWGVAVALPVVVASLCCLCCYAGCQDDHAASRHQRKDKNRNVGMSGVV